MLFFDVISTDWPNVGDKFVLNPHINAMNFNVYIYLYFLLHHKKYIMSDTMKTCIKYTGNIDWKDY